MNFYTHRASSTRLPPHDITRHEYINLLAQECSSTAAWSAHVFRRCLCIAHAYRVRRELGVQFVREGTYAKITHTHAPIHIHTHTPVFPGELLSCCSGVLDACSWLVSARQVCAAARGFAGISQKPHTSLCGAIKTGAWPPFSAPVFTGHCTRHTALLTRPYIKATVATAVQRLVWQQ